MTSKYDDIINLEHPVSKKHPQMSLEARSAQFAPFAALTGYSDEIKETARLTDSQIELSEDEKSLLNNKLLQLKSKIKFKPFTLFTYFVPDEKKDGGKYVDVKSRVLKIDDYKHCIILENKDEIPIDSIVKIVLYRTS